MATILVTGGAGFIGSCYVRGQFAETGNRVINLDKLTYAGNLDSLKPLADDPRHVFVEGDICDRALVDRLLRQYQPQAIVHMAAESHVDRSIDGAAEFVQTNVVGTFTMLEAARAYWATLTDAEHQRFRFLHVSTDEVHGSLGETGQFSETSRHAPNSPYAASKAAADHFVRAAYRTHGLPVLTTTCRLDWRQVNDTNWQSTELLPQDQHERVATIPAHGDGVDVEYRFFLDSPIDTNLAVALSAVGSTFIVHFASDSVGRSIVSTEEAAPDRRNDFSVPGSTLMSADYLDMNRQ